MSSFSLQRAHSRSPVKDPNARKAKKRGFLKVYPAKTPDGNSHVIEHTSQYTCNGIPLLYCDSHSVFVHADVFTDLHSFSPAMSTKEGIIGTLLRPIPFETLVRFLIESDIICTYVHISSSMNVTVTSDTHADIEGSHIYFTNEDNEDFFSFSLFIDENNHIMIKHR